MPYSIDDFAPEPAQNNAPQSPVNAPGSTISAPATQVSPQAGSYSMEDFSPPISPQPQNIPEQSQIPTNPGTWSGRSDWASIKQIPEETLSTLNALYQGNQDKVNSYGSSVAKVTATALNPGLQPEIQKQYESDHSAYRSHPDVKKHLWAATVGELAIPGLLTARAAGATGVAGMGALGLLSNIPGNKNDLNFPAGVIGAGLQAGANYVGGKLAKYLTQTGEFSKALKDTAINYKEGAISVPFKGQVLAQDLPGSFGQKFMNKWLDSSSVFGRANLRAHQAAEAGQSIANFAGQLSARVADAGGDLKLIQSNLKAFKTGMTKERDAMFTSTYKALDDNFSSVNLSDDVVKTAKEIAGSKGLSKETSESLTKLTSGKALLPSEIKEIRTSVSKAKVKMATNDQQQALYRQLSQLGADLKQDMVNTFKSNPTLLSKFQEANAFNQTYKEMFNPKTERLLNAAIEDVSPDLKYTALFRKFVTSPARTDVAVNRYAGMMGETGREGIESEIIDNLILKNIDYKTSVIEPGTKAIDAVTKGQAFLKLPEFLAEYKQMAAGSQGALVKDSYNALAGLDKYVGAPLAKSAEDIAKMSHGQQVAQNITTGTTMAGIAGGAGAAALGQSIPVAGQALAAGAAAYLVSMKAMSIITANSLLKRVLIGLGVSDKPGLTEYLTKKASELLLKAGVVESTKEGSQKVLEHQSESLPPIKPLSLNDGYEQKLVPKGWKPPTKRA